MRLLSNLLTKVTLSSMILTAPAMINGNTKYSNSSFPLPEKEDSKPFYSAAVIRKFIDHPLVVGIRAVDIPGSERRSAIPAVTVALMPAPVSTVSASTAAASPVVKIAAPEVGALSSATTMTTARAAELKLVINQASLIYGNMNLQVAGLDQKA